MNGNRESGLNSCLRVYVFINASSGIGIAFVLFSVAVDATIATVAGWRRADNRQPRCKMEKKQHPYIPIFKYVCALTCYSFVVVASPFFWQIRPHNMVCIILTFIYSVLPLEWRAGQCQYVCVYGARTWCLLMIRN